jgi:hypothetical protein
MPLLGLPHDRFPASSLAHWLLPSNELQHSSIENTAPIVWCGMCLWSHCLVIRHITTRSDNKVCELATVWLPWQQWTKTSVWFDDADISACHKHYVFGHYPSSCLFSKKSTVYFLKYVSKTGFCPHPQVNPTQLGPIDGASPYLRRPSRHKFFILFVLWLIFYSSLWMVSIIVWVCSGVPLQEGRSLN